MEASNAEKVVQRDQSLAEYGRLCADIEAAERLGLDTASARAIAKRFLVSFSIDRNQLVSRAWIVETYGCALDIFADQRLRPASGHGSKALYRLGDVIDYNPRPSGRRKGSAEASEKRSSATAEVGRPRTVSTPDIPVRNDKKERRKAAVASALKRVAA
jgi:hypothetical protein